MSACTPGVFPPFSRQIFLISWSAWKALFLKPTSWCTCQRWFSGLPVDHLLLLSILLCGSSLLRSGGKGLVIVTYFSFPCSFVMPAGTVVEPSNPRFPSCLKSIEIYQRNGLINNSDQRAFSSAETEKTILIGKLVGSLGWGFRDQPDLPHQSFPFGCTLAGHWTLHWEARTERQETSSDHDSLKSLPQLEPYFCYPQVMVMLKQASFSSKTNKQTNKLFTLE